MAPPRTTPHVKMAWHARSLKKAVILAYPGYNPARLINAVAWDLKFETEERLAQYLGFDCGQMNRVRHKKSILSDSLMIKIMDATGWSLKKVRELAGLPSDVEIRRVLRVAAGTEVAKAA